MSKADWGWWFSSGLMAETEKINIRKMHNESEENLLYQKIDLNEEDTQQQVKW